MRFAGATDPDLTLVLQSDVGMPLCPHLTGEGVGSMTLEPCMTSMLCVAVCKVV